MATGSCNCGAVSFEISCPITDVYVCHCSICRKATGGNGMTVVLVENSAFRWRSGEEHISTWEKPNAHWQTWFCSKCGSPVPGSNDESHMFVPAGLITDGEELLRVAHHLWVGSKAPWDVIGDSAQQHEQAFGN